MLLTMAQEASSVVSSQGLLGALLGGGVLTAVIGAYRFAVNFRQTERGLTRARITQANRNERYAQHEAGLWQGRSADLEYLLRSNGIPIPPLSDELRKFVEEGMTKNSGPAPAGWDDKPGERLDRS